MKTTDDLVSIVIPVYNGSNYLKEAIDSAICQTYKNIEIIVVNDGSTDDGETESIALSYGDKIRYFKKQNGGCASALNYGISQMKGNWFSWLSHDDVYLPDKIESAIKKIKQHNLSTDVVLSCGTSVIDADGVIVRNEKSKRDELIDSNIMFSKFMNSGYSLNGCALLISKKTLDTVGEFFEDYTYIPDWTYWVRIALAGFSFFEYSDNLVKNRRHKKQVSVQKQHLLNVELDKFADFLLESYDLSAEKLKKIWVFCFRNNFVPERKRIEQMTNIPYTLYFSGCLKRFKLIIMDLMRKVYRLRYK